MDMGGCMALRRFEGYAYRDVFTTQELAIYDQACDLVARVPYAIEGAPVRCHELARAIASRLGLTFQDGCYGMVEHSWLWLTPLVQLAPLPKILDAYVPGRVPQVQLVDPDVHLPFEYRKGPCRTDIDPRVIRVLLGVLT